jgi:hypothetical protein
MDVRLGGEVGQVIELVHHLLIGLGERQCLVQGDCWYTEDSGKANLYISSTEFLIREHFNNLHNFLKIFTKQFNPNPFVQIVCQSRLSHLEKDNG